MKLPPEIWFQILSLLTRSGDICTALEVSPIIHDVTLNAVCEIKSDVSYTIPGSWIIQFATLKYVDLNILIDLGDKQLPRLLQGKIRMNSISDEWKFPEGQLNLRFFDEKHQTIICGRRCYTNVTKSWDELELINNQILFRNDYRQALTEMYQIEPCGISSIDDLIGEVGRTGLLDSSSVMRFSGYIQIKGMDYRDTGRIRLILEKHTGNKNLINLIDGCKTTPETIHMFEF